MIRWLVAATVAAVLAAPAAASWADDPTPSPTPAAAASDSPSPSPDASSSPEPPADEPSTDDAGDPSAGTWICSSDGSDCELDRDCQQEAYAQGFDAVDYCTTPDAEPIVDAGVDAGDVAVDEFPYTPEELDALPDDSPLLTDGGWLAVDS